MTAAGRWESASDKKRGAVLRRGSASLLRIVPLVLAACGPTPGGTGDAEASASTHGVETSAATSSSATSEMTGVTTGGATDATTTGESTGETTVGGSSGSSGGPDTCPPGDEPSVTVSWQITLAGMLPPSELVFAEVCLVMGSMSGPDGGVVSLECPWEGVPATVELSFGRTPALDFAVAPGSTVRLELVTEQPWWTERWFALKEEGGALLLAGIEASKLVPTGEAPEGFFGVPVMESYGICAPTRYECGMRERFALQVTPFGTPVDVLDGQFRHIGDLAGDVFVWADEVVFHDVVFCTDTPIAWIHALLQASFGP